MGKTDTVISAIKWQITKYFGKYNNIDLTHHVYVCGLSGTGKTNTVMRILEKNSHVPYMVIEPTCARQYRNLSVSDRITHIYSLGEDTGESIELNPFYIPYNTDFTSHVELLKSCFASAISSKEPLVYQYLDRAILEIYYDKGWDRVSHINERLKQESDYKTLEHFFYFPRMRDLYDKVIELSQNSEFQTSGENRGTLIELLKSNIRIFLEGSLGRCFNTYRNNLYDIFYDNIVFEIPNPNSNATIGVLNILLGSIIHVAGNRSISNGLQHITVFEEAQLLFAADDTENKGRNDTAKKLEHLLSTGRKFGEGIIVVNQDPIAIHKSVLGNIRQRLIHKINSSEICNSLAKDYFISPQDIISTPKHRMWYMQEGQYKALIQHPQKVSSKKNRDIRPASPNHILGYAGLENINKQIADTINFLEAVNISQDYQLEVKRFMETLSAEIGKKCKLEQDILPEYMAYLTCVASIKLQVGRIPSGSYNELTEFYKKTLNSEDTSVPQMFKEITPLLISVIKTTLSF